MFNAVIALHITVCVVLVASVLFQSGKGASIGSSLGGSGGGGSQALFGSSGPTTFLAKITTVSAVIFMLTSLYLTFLSTNREESSLMRDVETVRTAPATEPAPTPPGVVSGGEKAE